MLDMIAITHALKAGTRSQTYRFQSDDEFYHAVPKWRCPDWLSRSRSMLVMVFKRLRADGPGASTHERRRCRKSL